MVKGRFRELIVELDRFRYDDLVAEDVVRGSLVPCVASLELSWRGIDAGAPSAFAGQVPRLA